MQYAVLALNIWRTASAAYGAPSAAAYASASAKRCQKRGAASARPWTLRMRGRRCYTLVTSLGSHTSMGGLMLAAIDPGYAKDGQGCAVAFFDANARLVDARFLRPDQARTPVDAVVIEQPQQDGRSWAIPPEVLIKLAWDGALLAGRLAGIGGQVVAYTPQAWKGSRSKPNSHWDMWGVLSDAERAVLGGEPTALAIQAAREAYALSRGKRSYPKTALVHNLLDAARIGCFHLGRVGR